MRRSSKIVLALAGLLLTVGAVVWLAVGRSEPPAEQLIQQSLEDAERAARRRSPSGVIETVSDDFQAGAWNKKRLYAYLLRSMRQGRGTNYDVQITRPRILPSPRNKPDERVVLTRFSAFYSDSGEDIWGSGLMTLVMRRETRAKWLIFREPRWRIVSVANIPPLPDGMGME